MAKPPNIEVLEAAPPPPIELLTFNEANMSAPLTLGSFSLDDWSAAVELPPLMPSRMPPKPVVAPPVVPVLLIALS